MHINQVPLKIFGSLTGYVTYIVVLYLEHRRRHILIYERPGRVHNEEGGQVGHVQLREQGEFVQTVLLMGQEVRQTAQALSPQSDSSHTTMAKHNSSEVQIEHMKWTLYFITIYIRTWGNLVN